MKEHWDNYARIGIVHPMAFPECLLQEGPFVETIRILCEDDFFGAVDVVGHVDPKQREEAGALLRNSKMQVTMAAQSVLLPKRGDLNHVDEAERQRAIAVVKECIDWAPGLNASRVSVLSGRAPADGNRDRAFELLLDSLLEICRYARETAGLPVAMKIFDFDVEKRCLVGRVGDAKRIAQEMRRHFPDFGLIHDLAHLPLCGEKPGEALPEIKDYLVEMHMGNSVSDRSNPLYGDTHPIFGVPGGDSDVPELADYLRALFNVGFLRPGVRQFLGFEIKPPPGVTSAMALANAKRTFKDAWALL